ncbi:hypothetical protein [Limnovirga soli]|uniref:Uncharacterized protein n=1 Tax=Limnovirga soli TaxID=2656915 RepID=A0A8J8FHB6_9BACT|nr:hypothetical protein [Limnovirga soli]NNV57883.1 hypothetical protein [Limnovirga soli]
MVTANVKLSKNELELVCGASFILTKNNIIAKVYQLFGDLQPGFVLENERLHTLLPSEVFAPSPKIYKGEQYQGLPYVMLDTPRYFGKEGAFAIRCFFWWGNFFSISLQLSGKYAMDYAEKMIMQMASKQYDDWYICVNEDHWQHHFEETNFLPFNAASVEAYRNLKSDQVPFFKIACKIPLTKWEEASDFFNDKYSCLIDLATECIGC